MIDIVLLCDSIHCCWSLWAFAHKFKTLEGFINLLGKFIGLFLFCGKMESTLAVTPTISRQVCDLITVMFINTLAVLDRVYVAG